MYQRNNTPFLSNFTPQFRVKKNHPSEFFKALFIHHIIHWQVTAQIGTRKQFYPGSSYQCKAVWVDKTSADFWL